MLLGVYLARSIIGPVTVLARAADAVRLSKANTLSLPKMFDRRDEIGDLARDLAAMTEELQNRMQATASFAADVSHEIKNPCHHCAVRWKPSRALRMNRNVRR